MNEEYLKGLHTHLGIKDDYDTWLNAVKDNEQYLKGLHGHLGIKDDYDTWHSSVLGKKKASTESSSTGAKEPTASEDFANDDRFEYDRKFQAQQAKKEPQLPVQLDGNLGKEMEVAGQRSRGEAVDGAPRVEFEKAPVVKPKSIEETAQSYRDMGFTDEEYDLIEMTDEEFEADLEAQIAKRRKHGEESIEEYEQRKAKQKEAEAKESGQDWAWNAARAARYEQSQKTDILTDLEGGGQKNPTTQTELENAKYREIQQGIAKIYSDIEKGLESETSLTTDFWVKEQAEYLGINPDGLSLEGLSAEVNKRKDYFEGILFERTVDKVAWKKQQEKSNDIDYTYFRRATKDAVFNIANDAVIWANDTFGGSSLTSERYQQLKAERRVQTQLELGHDIYDDRGIGDAFADGDIYLGWQKSLLGAADSWVYLASAILNPAVAIYSAGASGTLGTYEAYRDRSDLTEEEKQGLAFASGIVEGVITRVGMGNIRRTRAALGIVDDIGSASVKAKSAAYRKAVDFLQPISKKVAGALDKPLVRAGVVLSRDVAEEQAEELSIALAQAGLAYAIADDEFDPMELVDVAVTTLLISGPTSGITANAEYRTYGDFEYSPLSEDAEKFESLKSYYSDLKQSLKEEDLDSDAKKIIKDELISVKSEMNDIKNKSIKAFEKMSEEDRANVQEINKEIRKASKAAKKSDSPTVKNAAKKKIAALLEIKAAMEGSFTTREKADPLEDANVTETEKQSEEDIPVLRTAADLAAALKAKVDARKEEAKTTPSKAIDTRVRYLNPATNETVEGVLSKDGQRLVVETDNGNIIDIENFDEVSDKNLEDLNLSVAEGFLIPSEDGSFTYNRAGGVAPKGTKMSNNNGVKAIRRDKNGNVKNVLLTSPDGSETYNLKGEEAEEAAYNILLKETQTEEATAKVNEELELDRLAEESTKQEGEPVEEAVEDSAAKPVKETKSEQVDTKQLETVGDVAVDEKSKGIVNRMLSALKIVSPDLKIVMHSSRDSYNKTHSGASRDVGHFNPSSDTIHVLVDGSNPLDMEGYMLLKHEAIHPILESILASDPEFASRLEKRIKFIMNRYAKGTPEQERVLAHYNRYAKRSDQSLELLTEFLAVFSEPNGVKLLSKNKSVFQKIADLFQMIIDRVKGFRDGKIPTSEKQVINLAKELGKALSTGSAIDVDKTLESAKEKVIRSSLSKKSDPETAYQPKRGESPEIVKAEWDKSKNNFIVAEDFEHSLELRRMGFKETHQKDGKVYMSTPVRYEEYNASTSVAKIKSDSFIKESDIKDKKKLRVYKTLSALSKYAGYKMTFVDRLDLNFDSALVVPDKDNDISENTVVVNLAYSNARTGAGGLSLAVVETLRRKAPQAFNELYKNIVENKDSEIYRIFQSYVKNSPQIKLKEDKEFVAMANLVQELIDRATTSAVGESTTEFLNDFQSKLADVLGSQKEGDLKLAMMPLGENFVLAVESQLINNAEGYTLTEDTDVLERDIIRRLKDKVIQNLRKNNANYKRFYRSLTAPIPKEADMFGMAKHTMFDATYEAGYGVDIDGDVINNFIDTSNVLEFVANDQQLKEIGKIFGLLSKYTIPKNFSDNLDNAILNQNPENISGEEKEIYDFIIRYFDFNDISLEEQERLIDGNVYRFLEDIKNGNIDFTGMLYAITGEFELSMLGRVHYDVMDDVRNILWDGDVSTLSTEQELSRYEELIFESSLDIFEEVNSKIERLESGDPKQLANLEKAKTLKEAMKAADLTVPNVTADGVFIFTIKYNELKKYFPSDIVEGAERVFNERAFMTLKITPTKEGVLDIAYDVALDGTINEEYSDFPTGWNVGRNMSMPVIFKYTNDVAAILNSKGISFTAVETNKHPNIDISQYTKSQQKAFKEGGSPIMRRGLNNIAAVRDGNMVLAKDSKDIAVILDGKVFKTRDKDVLKFISKPHRKIKLLNAANQVESGELIGDYIKENDPALAKKITSGTPLKLEGRGIYAIAHEINENSFSLPTAEAIMNNYPMRSVYENGEKYVSSSGIRSMLSDDSSKERQRLGQKGVDAYDKMAENAEEAIIGRSKSSILNFVKKWFNREAVVSNTAYLQKAMKNGFADFIKAQFTALNGQRANADRIFQKVEKKIYGKLNTTDESLVNQIIFYRRVIQIDTNRENRLRDNKNSLAAVDTEIKSLKALPKDKETEKRIKNALERKKYFEEQVERYQSEFLHPSDGSVKMNADVASASIETLKRQSGDELYNKLNNRADIYFDEYRKILQETYEAGIIDKETRDRFISDDYSPRVFLEKMFAETGTTVFEHMNLNENQIAALKNGSDQAIFTDARYLLNLSLRSLKHKAASNKLFSAMDKAAAEMQYKMLGATVREANYKKDKEGKVIEDGFGNRVVEDADNGYKNIFYRLEGKKRAFQVKSEYYNSLMGIEERRLLTSTQRRRASRLSGTSTKKALVTGLRPTFAFIATSRGMVEVTRGRGVYDKYGFLPLMQAMALVDFIKNLPAAVMDGALVDDYFAHGGGMSFLTTQGRPEQIYKRKKSTYRRVLGKYSPIKGAGKALAFLGEKSEIALRLAIYTRTLNNLEKTRPELTDFQRKSLAVEEARMIADFSQGGYLTKDLDSVKPYLNAAIQGTRGTIEYWKENPKMAVFKQAQSLAIQTAITLLGLGALTPEEWEKIPPYYKNRYLMIPLFIKGENGRMLFLRIPKAHQFMFFDHFAIMTAESIHAAQNGEEYDWKMYDKDSKGDPTGYLSKEGFSLIDALLGSLPVGDLIPEEIFAPKKLSLNNFFWQVVSTAPALGAFDTYSNNIDRYRDSKIVYNQNSTDKAVQMQGFKDGRTRDIFKLTSSLLGGSAPKMQAAFEKLYANESSLIVNLMYQITDAIIETAEENDGGPQRIKDRKRKIDKTLGLKRSFIYELPEKKWESTFKETFSEIDGEGQAEKVRIRTEIGILYQNNDFDYKETTGSLPQYIQDYVNKLDPSMRRYAVNHAKTRGFGFKSDYVFKELAQSETAQGLVKKLKLLYQFDNWTDLDIDIRRDIMTSLIEAGLRNKTALNAELNKKQK